MKKLLLFLLLSNSAYAETDYFLRVGLGLDNNSATTKIASVGYQAPLWGVFDYQLEGGMFTHNNAVTIFEGASVGLSATSSGGVYMKLFTGPSFVSQTDDRLSSLFEFNNDLEFGVKETNVGLGLSLKHLSNAGIVSPNLGRNFVVLKVEFSL